jgi:hypothetical protein
MNTQPATSHTHGDWRDRASARAAMLKSFDEQADNIRTCVHWLSGHNVDILAVDLRRGRHRPYVTVAATTLLHSLLQDDCATVERKQQGAGVVYTWAAVRFGCLIRWQESA